jgi:hypothetical protein
MPPAAWIRVKIALSCYPACTVISSALNQLIFVPHLLEDADFQWIRYRKVVYIPKAITASLFN